MKKLFILAAVAFAFASCGNKDLSVAKFYENPVENMGKEVTLVGEAGVCCCSGAIVITGCDSTKKQMIRVIAAEGVVVPENMKGATIKVKGIISEEVIDEVYIATIIEKANAEQDSTARATQLAKAAKIQEVVAVEGIIRNYSINATFIEITKAANPAKCAEGKEGCAKKCEGHEGDSASCGKK